jgi:hypothetical protein
MEKSEETTQEKIVSGATSVDVIEAQGFDIQTTKKLVLKLDWHLIPFLSLIYL